MASRKSVMEMGCLSSSDESSRVAVNKVPGTPMRSTCPLNTRRRGEASENRANLMLEDPPLIVRIKGATPAPFFVDVFESA